jgi:hypothetical protein
MLHVGVVGVEKRQEMERWKDGDVEWTSRN